MKNYIVLLIGLICTGMPAADMPVNPIKTTRIKCYKQTYTFNEPQNRNDFTASWYCFLDKMDNADNVYYVEIPIQNHMSLWDLQETLFQAVGSGDLRLNAIKLNFDFLTETKIGDLLSLGGNSRSHNRLSFWPPK